MEKFSDICQVAIVITADIKDINLRKEKASRLVYELFKFKGL